jgi:hypothetical protein
LQHKANILNINIKTDICGETSFTPGLMYYRTEYNNKYELKKVYQFINKNGKKVVNKEWIDKVDAVGLAYWFMDDGSSYRDKRKNRIGVCITFATHGFSYDENVLLQSKLLDFGLESCINRSHRIWNGTKRFYYSLSLRQNSVNKFMDLVEPIISQIPCMLYKIQRRKEK